LYASDKNVGKEAIKLIVSLFKCLCANIIDEGEQIWAEFVDKLVQTIQNNPQDSKVITRVLLIVKSLRDSQ
jgi:hypothetical protein